MKHILEYQEFLNEELHLGSKERVFNTNSDHVVLPDKNKIKPFVPFKPAGLWYGFGNSWMDWIDEEMPEWRRKNFFTLKVKENDLCIIKNDDDLQKFEEEYAIDPFSIDWLKVMKDYSGIEIKTLFLHSKKFPGQYDSWLRSWDVASGCIWDKGAIRAVKALQK